MAGSSTAPARAPAEAPPAAAPPFLKRPEVRDVLAWMRLLVDRRDAAAVVRALSRPPIELSQVELARVIQVARRHRPDLVLGLAAATESPHVPPEARERIQRFIALHAAAGAQLDGAPPDVFLARLLELLREPGRPLVAPDELVQQRGSLRELQRLAVEYVHSQPTAGVRELVRHLSTVAPDAQPRVADAQPSAPDAAPLPAHPEGAPAAGEQDAGAQDAGEQDAGEQDADAQLQAAFALLREELLDGVARIGGRLGELRLDTDLDISHGVVRYLELLKLAALLQRPAAVQSLDDALADVNARLLAAATPLQREILLTSTLDATLGAGHRGGGADGERGRGAAVAREQRSLVPFLPRKGAGLALSASDVHTYRSCPLRYKYARVLRIPVEQTVHQRFGIVVHQVLERYHREGATTLVQMLGLLDACWRRAGFGEDGLDREPLETARAALVRYHARLGSQESQPVWFERPFSFRLGAHHLRGRVDRVDRLPVREGAEVEHKLIDYKTSRPKSAEQLHDDVQLSLYALAAREDWQLQSSQQAYYYVLDDLEVPASREQHDAEWVKDVVLTVGEGILAQAFDPTPSPAACAMCDYRITCPAALA